MYFAGKLVCLIVRASNKLAVKYTIEGVSKILVPLRPDLFPEAKRLVKGNQNLVNFWNGIH